MDSVPVDIDVINGHMVRGELLEAARKSRLNYDALVGQDCNSSIFASLNLATIYCRVVEKSDRLSITPEQGAQMICDGLRIITSALRIFEGQEADIRTVQLRSIQADFHFLQDGDIDKHMYTYEALLVDSANTLDCNDTEINLALTTMKIELVHRIMRDRHRATVDRKQRVDRGIVLIREALAVYDALQHPEVDVIRKHLLATLVQEAVFLRTAAGMPNARELDHKASIPVQKSSSSPFYKPDSKVRSPAHRSSAPGSPSK